MVVFLYTWKLQVKIPILNQNLWAYSVRKLMVEYE